MNGGNEAKQEADEEGVEEAEDGLKEEEEGTEDENAVAEEETEEEEEKVEAKKEDKDEANRSKGAAEVEETDEGGSGRKSRQRGNEWKEENAGKLMTRTRRRRRQTWKRRGRREDVEGETRGCEGGVGGNGCLLLVRVSRRR